MPSTNRMHFHRHRCPVRPVAAVGDDCSRSQSCGWNSVCGPYSGVCECAVGLENNQVNQLATMPTHFGSIHIFRALVLPPVVRAARNVGIPYFYVCQTLLSPTGLSSSNCHKFGFCDNGYCVCKAGYQSVAGFCLPPPRPVIDDPKAYVDPDLMAALLKKQGIATVESEHSAVSPFGMQLAKLRSGMPGATNEETNELGLGDENHLELARQSWQTTEKQQIIGDNTARNTQDALPNMGWPFQIGGSPMTQNDAAPAPEYTGTMIGINPALMLPQHSPAHESKAKGSKTFTLEERRQLLMRNSGKSKIEGQRVNTT